MTGFFIKGGESKMNQRRISRRVFECSLALALLAGAGGVAQAQPMLPPGELDRLVSRIALYPDPLLAQVLSAASYSDQIPEAAKWADEHHYLSGDGLAAAISGDHLPWDPSVQALLPFPSVLETMAGDMAWTAQLGNAVLAQRPDVMDAVQRMRRRAQSFGYLRSGPTVVVGTGPFITIMPARPDFYCVPVYDPAVVFVAPRPGFAVGAAINFGFGFTIGAAFRPWGWGGVRFAWDTHGWFIGDHVWGRTWANRGAYVHAGYTVPRYEAAHRVETHELIQRSAREREAARLGHERVEEEHRHR
jgi:hypothetical protein